jgi:hypothetical protein
MTRTERAAVLAAIAFVAGCDARVGPSAPRPTGVQPAAGFAAGENAISIMGESFPVRAVQSVSSRGSEVDARYRAWLDATVLLDVVWVDARTLRARVPAGLALGRHDLTVEGPSGRAVLAAAYEVLPGGPAVLGASMSVPGSASVGQVIDVAVTVTNLGEAVVAGVHPQIATSGTGAVALVAAAGTQDVPPGEGRTFVSRYRATAPGDVTFAASATGADPRTGGAVSAAASGSVAVDGRAELAATLSIPAGPVALGDFPVALTLANVGEATALGLRVEPPVLVAGSTGAAVLVSGPPVGAEVPPGVAATFTWTYRAVASGTLQLEAGVSWSDATGTARNATAISNVATVPQRADVLADPLADGSRFAYVAGYRGQLYLGPSQDGAGLVRMQLDGSAPESLSLALAQDRTGNASTNQSPQAPPYTSIGYTGCTPSSVSCGPDNEDGRGLLTSVTFGGDEWLLVGGARSGGELDYVYMSRGSTSPLAFSYVDLGSLLGAATRGFTAARVIGDRLYLGFADNGGSRPYGVALLTAPSAPGLDAVQGVHALELGLHEAYNTAYASFTTISMIDAIGELNGRVYFFDNSGCLGSKTPTPATKDDFFACSPTTDVDYALASAVDPTRQYDLEPRDRAWPQVAAWNGRLFAIRNTTSGPQLWCCEPGRRGDPLLCDRSDWYLVAGDATYRTRLGKATASAASLLVATPTHLFVGFDGPAGVHVFRTAVPDPTVASDFTGRDGCVAGTAGCEGIGGDGFGATTPLVRIFDAKAIPTPEGRTDLYLTTGDGVGPVHLVRITP